MHFPVPPRSRVKISLLERRAVEFISETLTLCLHVTPSGFFPLWRLNIISLVGLVPVERSWRVEGAGEHRWELGKDHF